MSTTCPIHKQAASKQGVLPLKSSTFTMKPRRSSLVLCSLLALPLLLLLLGDQTSMVEAILTPGTQAKLAVSFDFAKVVLEETNDYKKSVIKHITNLKIGAYVSRGRELKKLISIVGKVAKIISYVSVACAVFGVIATIFMDSELSVINERFDEINEKLDDMIEQLDDVSAQLNSITEELKSSIQFNAWITTFTQWEMVIRNGDIKLAEIQTRLRHLNNTTERLKLMESFVTYFENNDIEGKANNIHRITGFESTSVRENLFGLFIKEKSCDVFQLCEFMIMITNIMMSAAKQIAIYEFLKNGSVDHAREKIILFYDKLYEIRLHFQFNVWYCFRNSTINAKLEVQRLGQTNILTSGEQISKIIHDRLSYLMPWYEWGVVLSNKDKPLRLDIRCSKFGVNGDLNQYKIINIYGGNKVIIVWQHNDDRKHSCQDIADAGTFVPFQFCSGCNSDALTTSEHMISGKDCMSYFYAKSAKCYPSSHVKIWRSFLSFFGSDEHDPIDQGEHDPIDHFSFVAATFSKLEDPCSSSNKCNNHGICKTIPYTNNFICMCNPYFEGDTCESFQSPAADDNLIDMMAILREDFVNFSGVPTIIDVYFDVKKIPALIEELRIRITNSIMLTRVMTQYGQMFNDAEYIIETYSKFQDGEISEKVFADRLPVNRDIHRTLSDLKRVVLGTGFLKFQDFLTVYKKTLISESTAEYACTEHYSASVSTMKKNLVTMDQVMTEARLWRVHRQLQELTGPEDTIVLVIAQQVTDAARQRQKQYKANWDVTSCPKLSSTAILQNYCDSHHSYQGLQVNLNCPTRFCRNDNRRRRSLSTRVSVTCVERNGTLQWTNINNPVCPHRWCSWSSWSVTCSAICVGNSTRQRMNTNGEEQSEQARCVTLECCRRRWFRSRSPRCT